MDIDIEQISKIARLELSNDEKKKFSKDLEDVISWLSSLDKIELKSDIKPTFQPVESKNVTRDDVVEPSLDQETAVSNSKNREDGHFKGPRVI